MLKNVLLFAALPLVVVNCSSTPPAPPDGGSSTGGSAGSTSSGASGGGSSGGSTGSVTSTCDAYATAYCNLYESCSNGSYITRNFGSVAACVSAYEAQCAARLALPGTALTAARVAGCAQEVPGESCANLYSGNDPTDCLPPQGTTANGSGCALGADCQSAFCGLDTQQICGTCESLPGAGASCATNQCAPGDVCLSTTTTCAAPVQDGGACGVDDDCLFGFACIGVTSGVGYCAPSGTVGTACNDKKGPLGCDGRLGLACEDADAGAACMQVTFAPAGQSCGDVPGSPGTDCDDSLCFKPDGGKEGTCYAFSSNGQACSDVFGPKCQAFSRCVAGTCEALYSTSCATAGVTGGGSSGGTTGTGGATGTAGGTSGGTGSGGTTGAAPTTLLVDNDGLVGSGSDTVLPSYQAFLTGAGISYDTAQVANDGSQSSGSTAVPSSTQLAAYTTVVFFTGANDTTGTGEDVILSTTQEVNLTSWLDLGHKVLILVSPYLMNEENTSIDAWTTGPSDPLFSAATGATPYLPLNGSENSPDYCNGNPCDDSNILSQTSYTTAAAGPLNAGTLAGATWVVGEDVSGNVDFGAVSPASGIDTLLTIQADPADACEGFTGCASTCGSTGCGNNVATAVAIGNKAAGKLGTSTVIYVGVSLDAVAANGQPLFNGLLSYAGL